jgi:hypothetical protein
MAGDLSLSEDKVAKSEELLGIKRLSDEEQTRHRLEILNQFFRGMLLLNGGVCVALLAFLQAIWNNASPSFVRGILIGMAFFIGGLFFTVSGQYLRYEISKASQFMRKHKKPLQRTYLGLVMLSGLAFLIGAGVIVVATWNFASSLPYYV